MSAQAARPGLGAYRRFVVAFSGGKDSLAAPLHFLDLGVPTCKATTAPDQDFCATRFHASKSKASAKAIIVAIVGLSQTLNAAPSVVLGSPDAT